MKHEKIIRRDDGSRVKIAVELICEFTRDNPHWRFQCFHCAPGKRTWTTTVNHDEYSWRRLGYEERKAEDRRRSLLLASEDEVAETMRELIAKIVPSV